MKHKNRDKKEMARDSIELQQWKERAESCPRVFGLKSLPAAVFIHGVWRELNYLNCLNQGSTSWHLPSRVPGD